MGERVAARDARVAARARAALPLFPGGPVPAHAVGLERAINLARIVGVVLLSIGIVSGQSTSPLAIVLTALIAVQSAFVGWALRPPARWPSEARAISSAGDVLAVGIALFMGAGQDPWTHPAAPLLSVIVVGLRNGRAGALVAAVASTLLLLGAAAYRDAAYGIATMPSTFGSWIILYFLGALLMSGSLREIDLLRERERQQHARDIALLDAQSDLGEMLLVTDGEHVLETNDAVQRLTGRSATEPAGLRMADLFVAEDLGRVRERAEAGVERTEATMRGHKGRAMQVEIAFKQVSRDGGRFIGVAHDITERKRVERALEQRSLFDPLTGLPNRSLLLDRLEQAIAGSEQVTVVMLDVVNFRHVNDSLGFATGDDLLRSLAGRLRRTVRVTDTVSRVGGDEFAAVLAGGNDRSQEFVDAVATSLRQPFSLAGSNVTMDVAIGLGRYPDHGSDPGTLLQHAESAMYEAKMSGSFVMTYAPEHGATAPSQLVVAEMQRAMEAEELVLHYQPQVAMADGALVGLEALVRWRHPRLGLLPPGDFVPLIERTAIGRAFSDHILLRALRDRSSWEDPLRGTSLAVNVSGRDLLDPGLPGSVRLFLGDERPALPLKLEATEGVLISDPAAIRQTVVALDQLGVGFSIDDFGTGGSSFTHLVHLPVSELKIDRSFVSGMRTDPRKRAVVRSTIDLAHALGSHVVAEGIEDEETWRLLVDMRCDAAQGHLVARAMPPDELVRWLGSRPAAASRLS